MFRFILSFFGGIFTTITMGIAMIALSVGAVFWMYGRDLPSHESLSQYQPPTISRIYSGEGRIIDEFALERRLFTPAESIPPLIKQAFISAEDKNFYIHEGYDLRGIAAAAYDAVRTRGEDVRGASTITQQVMKNFLLSGDRRAERKIKELILASRVDGALNGTMQHSGATSGLPLEVTRPNAPYAPPFTLHFCPPLSNPPPSTLHFLPSTVCPLRSTLHTVHTLCRASRCARRSWRWTRTR